MKKLYIFTFKDSLEIGSSISHSVASAYDVDEAKHLVLDNWNELSGLIHDMGDLNEILVDWIEIPIQVSKQGTYFPKPVTHVIMGDGNRTKAIEILNK